MTIILPHLFQDGVNETASGVQVDENFNVLKAAIEALEATNAAEKAARLAAYAVLEPKSGRGLSTNYTPSTTKAAIVVLTVRAGPGADAICRVVVDELAAFDDVYLNNEQARALTFPVKANGKWQCQAVSGPMNLLDSTYWLAPA